MRCLTLAQALRKKGASCYFICRDHTGTFFDLIRGHGFDVRVLATRIPQEDGLVQQNVSDGNIIRHASWLGCDWQTDAEQTRDAIGDAVLDWLVVDHYSLDASWESSLKLCCKKLMVIDDLADRSHDCDMLIDQNLGRDTVDYLDLIPQRTVSLCGPSYALLRPEFKELRSRSLKRRSDSDVHSILVFMGGTDVNNITYKVLSALCKARLNFLKKLVVVMGSSSPSIPDVKVLLDDFECHAELLVDTLEMHEHMLLSDLSIGAAGGAAWERCCLGLPSILITVADNQKKGSKALVDAGAAESIDFSESSNNSLVETIQHLSTGKNLSVMSSKASSICDGGGVNRIFSQMCMIDSSLLHVRCANIEDEALLLEWANDPVTRRNAINQKSISGVDHANWFAERLNSDSCIIYIVNLPNGDNLGQIRFEKSENKWLVDYSISPVYRGQGLGAALLGSGISALTNIRKDEVMAGWIKLENTASIAVFVRCGFLKISTETNGLIYFERVLGR